MSRRPRIAIVDWHEKREFYQALTLAYAAEWTDVSPAVLANDPPNVDLVLVNDETWSYCAAGIAESKRRGIPVLHLADGICEWRNTWENPRGLSFLRPVLATKIACLGAAQARLITSWGNEGKCVVTGSPRFDALIGRRPRERGVCVSILIATARQPYFNETHRDAAVTALRDLKLWFGDRGDCQAVWRVTAGLDEAVGVRNAELVALPEQLAHVDAVISTPSNVILEAMLYGLPVAVLDYANSPAYVSAAWTITAPAQIGAAIGGLIAPDAPRMEWQRTLLADQLECATPATPRVIALMERMINGEPEPAPVPVTPDRRVRELEAEVTHLRRALALRPTQVLYRTLCELKRWLGSRR
ncbi:MAG: hypothetical protein HYX27_24435 [Acidobacteria bacterium]|nr:hypothetical protein [Acidobacteriota bacterium]